MFFLKANRIKYPCETDVPSYIFGFYFLVISSFIISLGFLVYGVRLYLMHRLAREWEENHGQRRREITKVLLCTLIFSLCFISRGLVFLWWPVFKTKLDPSLFMALAYYVPELVPSIIEFFLFRATKKKEEKASKFIADLYQQEEAILKDEANIMDTFHGGDDPVAEHTYLLK
eukprot:TRINITY_DN3280_c0_g1_i1.p1 TRINITY_DN3280_c0_g1~~TRINITY_DN3280_c0_g1_i1.p1  ORF type:complete len:173 (+),score=21.24 TRINITY_DN3280_c0_g1_i1:587-1105(+)